MRVVIDPAKGVMVTIPVPNRRGWARPEPLISAFLGEREAWLRRHLAGEISLAEAAEGGKMDTRRYTKRQATWFRNQMPGWTWVTPEAAEAAVLAQISA